MTTLTNTISNGSSTSTGALSYLNYTYSLSENRKHKKIYYWTGSIQTLNSAEHCQDDVIEIPSGASCSDTIYFWDGTLCGIIEV